jgi:hypothetical protein
LRRCPEISFYTGTQVELLYAMPASGAAVTAAAATVMSGTTAANPPYALPLGFFQQQSGGGAGKSLLIKGGGWWSAATAARTTNFQIGLNSTAGTGAIALPFGKTGTLTTVVTTLALFDFEVLVTATSPGFGATTSVLNALGWVEYGVGNNAATGTFGTYSSNNASRFMIGTGSVPINPVPTTQYFVECSNTWDAVTNAPTITLTNFLVFGLN